MTNNSSQSGLLPLNFDEATRFLDILADVKAPFTFQTFDDVKVWSDEKQKFVNRADKSLAKIFNGTFDQHKKELKRLNLYGAGVYVTANETDLQGRTESNITNVRALFVDLDGMPLKPILDLPKELQPHLIIESSPERWHAYWLVNDCPLEQFKPLQQALAAKFNGDKAVCDLPRVMRLAGFTHNKDASKPFVTRIVTMHDGFARFSVNQLIVGLELNNLRGQEHENIKTPSKSTSDIGILQSGAKNNVHKVHLLGAENDPFDGILNSEQVQDLKSALLTLPCDDYHDWVSGGSELKSIANEGGFDLWLEWSAKSTKFDHTEAVKKWHELKADRTSYRAIFAKAQALGWKNPQSKKSIVDTALHLVREVLAKNDAGLMFEDTTIVALKTLYTSSKSNYARIRNEIKQNRTIKLSDLESLIKPVREAEQGTTERLLEIAKEQCDFFHDKDNEPFAAFVVNGCRQCYHLQSKGFREWLANELYKADETAPADNIINAIINALGGQAKFDGKEKPVYMRVAEHEGAYWLDLCNDKWQAVKVTSTGWQVIDSPDVLFTRSDNMRPLPMPTDEGDLSPLWELVNVQEQDRISVLAWLLECLRPDTPYPLLELTGEQGSSKSTTQKHLRKLIDPNKSNLRAAPKQVDDIWVTAYHSHLVSFENVSHLSAGYQDALCILSTGGAYNTRTLHTTTDETCIELKKPVMLNGIPVNVTAQDLLDRTVHLDLPIIESRLTEREVEELFDQHYQTVFTGLLDLFVSVLATLPSITDIEKCELPRMADFTLLGEAVARLHGKPAKTFLGSYQNKRTEGIYRTLESSPVAVAALGYLEDNPGGYDGTVKGLLVVLTAFTPQGESWPRSAKGFADLLRRLAPAFRSIGINAKISEKAGRQGYGCVLKYLPKNNKETASKGELSELGLLPTFATDIYNTTKTDEKGDSTGEPQADYLF